MGVRVPPSALSQVIVIFGQRQLGQVDESQEREPELFAGHAA
jgi:hypothetical protein